MKQVISFFVAGIFSFILFYTYAGIGFNREWNDSTVFMKHKPKLQLFFESKAGESDHAKTSEDLVYEEYFEKNRKSGLYTLIVYMFLQAWILFFIIPSYILAFKIKNVVPDIKRISIFISAGIFIKLLTYVFAWNIWGMGSKLSYLPLLIIMIAFDCYLFWIQRDTILKSNDLAK